MSRSRYLNWLIACFSLGLLALVLAWTSSAASEGQVQRDFGICGALFTAATISFFMARREIGSLNIADLTCWLTGVFLVEFVLAPWIGTYLDIEDADMSLLPALKVVILGVLCFWVGSVLIQRKGAPRYVPTIVTSRSRRWTLIIAALTIGVTARLYLLLTGLGGYVQAQDYASNLSQVTPVNLAANLAWFGLVLLVVEHHAEPSWRTRSLLWGSAALLAALGAVGGMKEDVGFVALVMLISERLIRQRLNWKLLVVAAIFGLLLVPVNEIYRQELRSTDVPTVQRKAKVLVQSAQAASESTDLLQNAEEGAVNRLDLMSTVHFLVDYPDIASLRYTDLNALTALAYPFAPRALWPEKPILDVGSRLSVAMGAPESTSTAVTPIGALLIIGGSSAVAMGMFFFGSLVQWFSNLVNETFDCKTVLVYVCIFRIAAKPESDFVFLYGTVVQNLPLVLLIASVAYGGRPWRAFSTEPDLERAEQSGLRGPEFPVTTAVV